MAARAQFSKTSASVVQVLDDAPWPLTRAQIGAAARLSRPTVTSALSALLDRGLVDEVLHAASATTPGTIGRPPTAFRLTHHAGSVIAIDIGRHSLRVGIIDSGGDFVSTQDHALRHERRINIDDLGPRVLSQAADSARTLLDEADITPLSVRGVGIGLPAPITRDNRVAGSTYLLGWNGVDIANAMSVALDRVLPRAQPWCPRVFVDNDANLAALGHLTDPVNQSVGNLLFVKVSSGVGGALVLANRLHRGGRGVAGEIGHMALPTQVHELAFLPADPRDALAAGTVACSRCGKPDCLELHSSAEAMMRALRLRSPAYADKEATDVIREALSDPASHPLCNAAIAAAGRALGYGIAQAITLFDPDQVALGGVLADAGDLLLGPLRETVAQRGLGFDAVPIVYTSDRRTVGLRGAAALALRRTAPLFVRSARR